MARAPSTLLAQLAALIDHMAATPGYVGKQTRDLETAVARLVAGATHQADRQPDVARYRIDDLARISGVTTRNIRAYRERGLLPAPRRVGRVTLYSEAHVSRLALISSMLSRGYGIAHIDELLTAWQHGGQIADVLGLEHELTDIQDAGGVRATTLSALAEAGVDAVAAARLARLGILTIGAAAEVSPDQVNSAEVNADEVTADEVSIDEPDLLDAILPLLGGQQPASAVLDLVEQMMAALDPLRSTLADAAGLTEPADGTTDQQLTAMTLALIQLRALADAATRATLTQATNTLLSQFLATRYHDPTGTPVE